MIVWLDNIVDFYDVGMIHHLQNLYLSSYCLFAGWFTDFTFFISFNSYFFISRAVDGNPNRSVCPLSNNLSDDIVLFELGSEVVGSASELYIFLVFKVLLGQSSQHFINLVIEPKKLDICKIPLREDAWRLARLCGLGLDLVFLFRVVKELI